MKIYRQFHLERIFKSWWTLRFAIC